jgi:hypothetical protein
MKKILLKCFASAIMLIPLTVQSIKLENHLRYNATMYVDCSEQSYASSGNITTHTFVLNAGAQQDVGLEDCKVYKVRATIDPTQKPPNTHAREWPVVESESARPASQTGGKKIWVLDIEMNPNKNFVEPINADNNFQVYGPEYNKKIAPQIYNWKMYGKRR